MRFTSKACALFATGALLFSAAACSDDDGDADAEAVDAAARDEMVAELLATSDDDELTEAQVECFVDGMIDSLGEEETQAFVDDPDAWTGEQVEIAMEEGSGATPAMDALGDVFEDCGIDIAAEVEAELEAEDDLDAGDVPDDDGSTTDDD